MTLMNELDPNGSKLNTAFNSTVPDLQHQDERGNHHLTELGREQSEQRVRWHLLAVS